MKNVFKISVSVVIAIVPPACIGIAGYDTVMKIMILPCIFAACLIHIDRIEQIKGAGVEAKLKSAVDEAYVTIEILKKIEYPLVVSMMDTLTWAHRLTDGDNKKREKLFEELTDLVEELGLESEKITFTVDEHYSLEIQDRYNEIIYSYQNLMRKNGDSTEQTNNIGNNLHKLISYKDHIFPTEEAILKLLRISRKELSQEVIEALNNYNHHLSITKQKISNVIIN